MVEQAKPTRSDPSPGSASGGPTNRDEANVASATAQSSSGEEEYQPNVSQEALKGPQGPPPPEYEFEKRMDGRGESQASHQEHRLSRAEDHHSHGAHFPRKMSKLTDRIIGRAAKAGNHLHSTNR